MRAVVSKHSLLVEPKGERREVVEHMYYFAIAHMMVSVIFPALLVPRPDAGNLVASNRVRALNNSHRMLLRKLGQNSRVNVVLALINVGIPISYGHCLLSPKINDQMIAYLI